MWIRLLLSCLQRKSNKPVRFIISSVDSATESTGDTAIYWESQLTPLSMATIRAASQLEKLRVHCLAVLLWIYFITNPFDVAVSFHELMKLK